MAAAKDPRQILIKEVWPDKLLYGTILLVISSAMGLLHGLLVLTTSVSLSPELGRFFTTYPTWLTVALSLVALVLALVAWRRLLVNLGIVASACGILSLSLFGIGSLHAVAALLFLIMAKVEREDKVPVRDRVNKWEWPDKALAASLLLLLAGTTAIAWGLALYFDLVRFGGENQPYWGAVQVVAGLVGVVAAEFLYHQRAPFFGVVAALALVATLGGYLIAPGLAVAALVSIALAWRENEFGELGLRRPSARVPPPGDRRGT